jgi:hypothetical protein
LFEQRLWNLRTARGYDDDIVGRMFRPSQGAVPGENVDVVVVQLREA